MTSNRSSTEVASTFIAALCKETNDSRILERIATAKGDTVARAVLEFGETYKIEVPKEWCKGSIVEIKNEHLTELLKAASLAQHILYNQAASNKQVVANNLRGSSQPVIPAAVNNSAVADASHWTSVTSLSDPEITHKVAEAVFHTTSDPMQMLLHEASESPRSTTSAAAALTAGSKTATFSFVVSMVWRTHYNAHGLFLTAVRIMFENNINGVQLDKKFYEVLTEHKNWMITFLQRNQHNRDLLTLNPTNVTIGVHRARSVAAPRPVVANILAWYIIARDLSTRSVENLASLAGYEAQEIGVFLQPFVARALLTDHPDIGNIILFGAAKLANLGSNPLTLHGFEALALDSEACRAEIKRTNITCHNHIDACMGKLNAMRVINPSPASAPGGRPVVKPDHADDMKIVLGSAKCHKCQGYFGHKQNDCPWKTLPEEKAVAAGSEMMSYLFQLGKDHAKFS